VLPRCNTEGMTLHLAEIEDILDHCCFAWNCLTDQPWRVMSIGLRQWAHG